jgi:hypothetical protein
MTAVYSASERDQCPIAGPLTVHIQMFVHSRRRGVSLPEAAMYCTSGGVAASTVIKLRHRVVKAALDLATATKLTKYTSK